ncbi:hypothetical protein A0O34_17940 [Chryseobacterium glaciei]|uniref:TonB-dependent receptor plug domain-containing protein n=1 Tax=Chryseobacterium glaciei TaxID=1685010 RepID=A0A172XZA3_9FLAO|nr:TonB-dependent receptor plug domain-containing protein [Chryseobacterium glaciei]ANF52284.1 hypothetical protein A0O34_17940 [Chryseobacterium glaciei]
MSKKLILLFIFGVFNPYQAQEKAEQALKTFEQKYPQEKIHLLFNKENYVAGENIWFKSFVFEGYNPSNISTSLFVELYDNNKNQISKKIFPLLNGEGSGSILLPETLKENVYYVRAYTTWMANFSEDFQLIKPIIVYNPSSPEKITPDTNSAWSAFVYPESGTFVNGINTKFAVRLQSKDVPPLEWEGYVTEIDKPDTKMITFKGLDQNVGLFNITPESGKKYQLTVQDKKGQKQTINLPEVSSSGLNLQVVSSADNVKYTLKTKNISPEAQYYKVLGTINNQLVYKAKINKISDGLQYSIPNNQLINGILQLTVFDDKENIVANRLTFVQPQLLQIKKPALQSLSIKNGSREKSSFDITKDINCSNYTVLVIDSNTNSSEEEQSFLSTLWLTGDITSNISHPSQYFTKNRNVDALDALLISEKWKRFDWKYIISGNYPSIKYQPENYLSYKGKVNIQGKPAPNTDLNLMFASGSGTKLFQVKTDNNGFFTLNNLAFENSMKFSYQLNSKESKNESSVYFQPNFSFIPYKKELPTSALKLTERTVEDKLSTEIARSITTLKTQKVINEKITDIEEVVIKGQRKDKTKKLNSELSSGLFRSANEQIFDFVNDPQAQGSTNILQWLQGRVAGLQIQSQNGTSTPYLRGSKIGIYLDEMAIEADQISSLSVSDIAMVKVIKGFFAGGFGGGNGGAIAIYTRRGGSSGSIIDSSKPSQLRQITLNGYDQEGPFNNPNYENQSFKDISQDTRSVLYWNPYLEVQEKEPTSVQFYNNDDAKNYKVIIIGFDRNNDTPIYYNEILP